MDHSPTASARRTVAARLDPRLVPFPDPFDTVPFFLTLHRAKNGGVAGGRFNLGTAALAWRPVAALLELGRTLNGSVIQVMASSTAKLAARRMALEGQLDPAFFAIVPHIDQ